MEQVFDTSFGERQNNRACEFPVISGRKLEDVLREKMGTENFHANLSYFSWLDYDTEIGIIEEVYGAKWNKKGFNIQKLFVIPADKKYCPLSKNCYYETGGCGAGFHSYGYDGKDGRYYGYMNGFKFSEIETERVSRKELFDLDRILWLDSSLKYCAYKSGNGIYAIDYIGLYKKYPICEMLMKLGIKRMWSEKALDFITKNKDFQKWLFKNADKVSDMAFQTARNAFKKNASGDPQDYLRSLKYRIQCGKDVRFTNEAVYKKALKYATQEKLSDYIKDNNIASESYGDYLTACDWLHLDFADTKVLFPKDFKTMHDDYTAQYAEYTRIEKEKEYKKKYAELTEKMKQQAEKFAFLSSFKDSSYCVIVAKSKFDLINEGEKLHHCVGRMDYDKRQAEGQSIICFIRKNDNIETPFATAEIKIGNSLTVNQCYGDRDRTVPEVQDFVSAWIKYSNKQYKKLQGA